MSLFTAENVVVSSGGGPSGTARVSEWNNAAQYGDGDVVIFNGSQYVASGTPAVSVPPPIEVASPVILGQPRWLLAARGRSRAVPWDETQTYYADQVVTYLGGVYVLDAATIQAGTRPGRDRRWTKQSEVLTEAEAERIANSDFQNVALNTTVSLATGGDEVARVRRHFVTISSAFGLVGNLYTLRFPRPINNLSRPLLSVAPRDNAGSYGLPVLNAITSGNQVTGYTFNLANFLGAGAYTWEISVKQMIDEVPTP